MRQPSIEFLACFAASAPPPTWLMPPSVYFLGFPHVPCCAVWATPTCPGTFGGHHTSSADQSVRVLQYGLKAMPL